MKFAMAKRQKFGTGEAKEIEGKLGPEKDLSSKYYIASISDSTQGFRILLSDAKDESKNIEVLFEASVANSEYLQWLSVESYGIAESEPLIHFSFLAVDSILDVIAAYEPKIYKRY